MPISFAMLDSHAILQRPTIGRDSASGVTQNPFVTIAENLPCNLNEGQGSVNTLYDQRNEFIGATIYFQCDPGARVNDRLIITRCRTGVTATFLVQTNSESDTHGMVWQVRATKINAPRAASS